ncbi:MAG: hypothetical protein U9N35_08320 [Euryarchaeota archaeon]|nr:hypothetical protein [Euryarchaeota archaeon]
MEDITLKMLDSEKERKKIYRDVAFLIFNKKDEEEIKELLEDFYQKSAIYSNRDIGKYSFGLYIVLNSFFIEKKEYTPLKALKYARENEEKEMIESLSRFARYAVEVRNVQNYSIEPKKSLEILWFHSVEVIKKVVESYK